LHLWCVAGLEPVPHQRLFIPLGFRDRLIEFLGSPHGHIERLPGSGDKPINQKSKSGGIVLFLVIDHPSPGMVLSNLDALADLLGQLYQLAKTGSQHLPRNPDRLGLIGLLLIRRPATLVALLAAATELVTVLELHRHTRQFSVSFRLTWNTARTFHCKAISSPPLAVAVWDRREELRIDSKNGPFNLL
jgi:hypothetical protein